MSLESLAHALQGNLTCDPNNVRDWDRLTAMAMGCVETASRTARESHLNALGMTLIALKHSGRLDLHARAVAGLLDCLRWRLKDRREDRRKVARLAIVEWMDDNCGMCRNAREDGAKWSHVFDTHGVKVPCPRCLGSGRRRYTDMERAAGLGVQDGSKWGYAMDIAHAQITLAISLCTQQATKKLQK